MDELPQSDEAVAANIESAIESQFGNAPKPAPKPAAPKAAPEPVEAAPAEDVPAEPVEGDEPTDEPAEVAEGDEQPVAEPEFEIDVDGQKEVIRGADKIKEMLQKGIKAGRGLEENARGREQLAAQAQMLQINQQFQSAVFGDIVELQALDKQIEAYGKIDMVALIDQNFLEAAKVTEQKNSLRDARNMKLQQIQMKQQQFEQGQQQAAAKLQSAEMGQLLAKLPAWRNSETRLAEDAAIRTELSNYGFRDNEILNIMDHRMVLVARDAMKYRALQRGKQDAVKQVRTAPPVAKPGAAGAQNQLSAQQKAAKDAQEYRRLGQKGRVRDQEAVLEKMFSKAFK